MNKPTTLCIDYQDLLTEQPPTIDSIQYPNGETFDPTQPACNERDEMILVALAHLRDTKKLRGTNNTALKNSWKPVSRKNNFHFTSLQSHLVTHRTRSENILFVMGDVFDVLHYTHMASNEKYQLQKNLSAVMSKGFHVVGIGTKQLFHSDIKNNDVHGLAWLGAILVQLAVKNNIYALSQRLQKHNMSLRIFSDDTLPTSKAIARTAGITCSSDACITGLEMRSMGDAELQSILPHTILFAELSELDKNRIIRLLEQSGETIADSYEQYAR